MNKIIKKISQAVQVLLLAPIKLPGKALNIIKYVAVGLGILEAVTRKDAASHHPERSETESNGDLDKNEEERQK